MTNRCLSEEMVFRFVQGGLDDRALAEVDDHLSTCADCRRVVAEASEFFGAHVGRYQIEEDLGAGAAGFVYRAFDPQLQRRVALKLIAGASNASSVEAQAKAQARLLREARAMAKLSHPNVVSVHDAGLFEDQVFVVMEMVDGNTLARWLAEPPRSWREILDAFIEAGRGLAAAHAARLVHRDFKPDNVLMGTDGRVCVTDFGLAHPADFPAAGPAAGADRAGTPAYMAPEQFLGQETDARTDQFSFCVALYAALYRQRPFGPATAGGAGRSLQDLAREVVAGHLNPPPEPDPVPPGIFAAIRRGLSVLPDGRYPSMNALLAELVRQRAGLPARGRRVVLAAGLLLVLLVGAGVAMRGAAARCGNGRTEAGEACDDGNDSDRDGCLQSCRAATCGDGFVRIGTEDCDEGGKNGTGKCTKQCVSCAGERVLGWSGNGHCYSFRDGPLSWEEARATCGRTGGDVVTYTETPESDAVFSSLLDRAGAVSWIGLRASAGRDVRFGWVTGEPFAATWWRWEQGEPRAVAGTRRCATESRSRSAADPPVRWTVAACGDRNAFVCERGGWSTRATGTHTYKLFTVPLPWAEAKAACERAGTHLATVADIEENSFVAAMAPEVAWLGGGDARTEGSFAWITGEPFTFRHFAPREPDESDGRSDCLALSPYLGWRDRDCTMAYPYLCEGE